MQLIVRSWCLLSFSVLAVAPSVQASGDGQDLFDLSLEELLQVKVHSASNLEESLAEAPATMIVLSKDELTARGYDNLTEVLDDLPGMEMVRPFGDTYFVNYMRGYRNTIGTPYLVLIDGVVFNSLYFNITMNIAALPLSNVQRIEVVYGPASSVYGANAFMGVVNVITRQPTVGQPSQLHFTQRVGSDGGIVSDMTGSANHGELIAQFSARLEHADLRNRIDNQQVYWLQDQHYANRALWGEFLDYPQYAQSRFSSALDSYSIDARLNYRGFELAAQYSLLDSGYGTIYPADKIPANSTWPLYQGSYYLRYQTELSPHHQSKTLLRYRTDGVANNSHDLEAWNLKNSSSDVVHVGGIRLEPGQSARMLHFQYWASDNHSWTLQQDFDSKLSDNWSLAYGAKYEYKDLQKAYQQTFSGSIAASSSGQLFRLPVAPKSGYIDPNNRIVWRDWGMYVQSKYRLSTSTNVNLGVRFDENSAYGNSINLRGAYNYQLQNWNFKLMYGEGFQEPTPRSLYGAWTGSGADPNLAPETSETIEASAQYVKEQVSHLWSWYHINNNDTVINFSGGARNAGTRDIIGVDYHLSYQFPTSAWGKMTAKAYASYYLKTDEQTFDLGSQQQAGTEPIGDLAKFKLWAMLDWRYRDNRGIYLTARHIAARDTVVTNPVRRIPSYTVFDVNSHWTGLWQGRLDLSLRVLNIFNKTYFHPGIREADSGAPELEPALLGQIGFSNDDPLAWQGSQGWYNSRLPQPERRAVLSMTVHF